MGMVSDREKAMREILSYQSKPITVEKLLELLSAVRFIDINSKSLHALAEKLIEEQNAAS